VFDWHAAVSRPGLAIVVLVQFAALIAVCLLVGDNGWDDGAITLAFSRTFARHGVIALTPHSETVEGFSSVSWFLLNALPALARPAYSFLILASQIFAALCICASTVLLARTCALLRFDKLGATLTVVTFAAWGCSFSEASNGMEMGLLTAAILMVVNELLAPQPRLRWLAAGVVLAVATRFEASATVALLAVSVWSVPGRRAFRCVVLAGLGAVLLLTSWRLAVFSDVVPNTFWAKRWPPYAGFGLGGRLTGALELPSFFVVTLVVLAVVRASGFDLAGAVRARRRAVWILACPIVGAVVVGALIGKHWGYWGRMPYAAFPFALVLSWLVIAPWVDARRGTPRIAVAVGLGASAIAVSMLGFPSGSLAAALHGGDFGVTPHTYAESGRVFRRFASAAALPHPTVLTPDLGGLALCCEELRVVDLALLSNRKLAHRGPAALADVLEAEAPHMIEAHWEWASRGGLYDLPAFRTNYVPAFAGGTKLWLRRDVARTIQDSGGGCTVPVDRHDLQEALRAHRYANHDVPGDRKAFEAPGVVVTLDCN